MSEKSKKATSGSHRRFTEEFRKDAVPGSVGVLAAVQRESHVLSNETDSGAGIALHRPDLASSITVSTSVTDAIAFAFERVRVNRAGSPTFVETYIALTPSEIRVWTRDETAEQGRVLRTIDDTPAETLIDLVQVSGQLRIVVGDTGGSGEISMYDPKFTPARPPETFLASPHDDLLDARPFEIQCKVNDAAESQTVSFVPKLLMQDRLDATLPPHNFPLSDLFARVGRENEITIWRWNPRDTVEGVPWERGLSWCIAWRGELTIDGTAYELDAKLFEPLAAKMLKPTPYSSVAPKMAAVALFDSGNAGARAERMQRTLLFGDAAAAAGGSPTVVLDSLNHLLFRYQSTDRETVDVPRLPTSWEGPRHLILLNYLVNGQVIATACPVT